MRRLGEPLHPCFVAKDGTASSPRRRIDRQNGNLVSLSNEIDAELVDHGRFADARDARDPDPVHATRMREEPLQELPLKSLVRRPAAFDERDRARQNGPVAGQNALLQRVQPELGAWWRRKRFVGG